jgi:hypothetical protein
VVNEKAAESQREYGFESGALNVEKPDRSRDEREFNDDSPEPQNTNKC